MDQRSEPTLVYLPKETSNDESAKLLAWRVPTGTKVTAGQALAEFETSKTTFELRAPAAGFVQCRHEPGAEISVGRVVCLISEDGRAPFPEEQTSQSPDLPVVSARAPGPREPAQSPAAASEPVPLAPRFSPRARELISRNGVDPAQFTGQGLVRSADVMARLGGEQESSTIKDAGPTAKESVMGVKPAAGVPFHASEPGRSKRLEIAFLRSGAQHTLPSMVTLACQTSGFRAAAERAGLSPSAILVYEVGRLLRKFPALNSFFAAGRCHTYEEVNVGFAIDAGRGLKVPVLRRADEKSLQDLDQELREAMVQFLNDELPVESLAGGTFTMTDLAQEGATSFSPLINQGQGAILGVAAEAFLPGHRQGTFSLMLTFDHQLSNGREASRFLGELKARLAGHEKAWGAALQEDPYCHHCERTLSTLREFKAHLVEEVRTDGLKGYVCSLCLKGL